jgi:hypothetical protein
LSAFEFFFPSKIPFFFFLFLASLFLVFFFFFSFFLFLFHTMRAVAFLGLVASAGVALADSGVLEMAALDVEDLFGDRAEQHEEAVAAAL